jgi:hypothetical protein
VQRHRDVPHLVARQHDRHRVGGKTIGDHEDVIAASAQGVDDEMAGGVGRRSAAVPMEVAITTRAAGTSRPSGSVT